MNEELQTALAQMIESFVGSLSGATEFALDQAPEVIQQLLLWRLVESGVHVVFALMATLASAWGIYRILATRPIGDVNDLKKGDSNFWWEVSEYSTINNSLMLSFAAFPIIIFACIGLIVGFVSTAETIPSFLQIWLAPKVYLIEYAANLAR